MTANNAEDNLPFNGYTPSDQDIIIDGCRLIMTSMACPEQYDVFDENDKKVGYLRLRHGTFRADAPVVGGDTVYESHPKGDGVFEDDERIPELRKAVAAIKNYHAKGFNNAQ